MDTVPYSINLMVSVDKFDKICSFINIIFAASLHFIKFTLIRIYMALIITTWLTVVGVVR